MTKRNKLFFASAFAAALALGAGVSFAQEHAPVPSPHEEAQPRPLTTAGATHEETHGPESEHGAAEAHGHGEHGPEPLNWTDIFDKRRPAILSLLINFGLLVGLYYTLGKKPIAAALKQRRVTIGKDIEDAQKMLAEAKERAKKYQGDLKNADADADTAKGALVAAGKGEVERQLRDAEERAARMKRDAERLVEQERKQVRVDLHLETVELAMREATALLEKSTTPEDHARLAQDLLAELSKQPAASEGGVS